MLLNWFHVTEDVGNSLTVNKTATASEGKPAI